ncbi:MAG: hypothetical protein WC619_05925 [Patescibacteria group bacterium]
MDKGKNGKEEKIGQKINVLLTRYFKWLVVLFVLVVFILGYFLLLKPKYEEIAKLTSDGQSSKEQEYLERRGYLESLKNLVAVFQSVKLSDQEKIDYILRKKDVPEELFSQVEAIVKKNGLLLKSLKIEPIEPESKSSSQKVKRGEEKAAVSLPPEIGKTKATLEIMGVDYFGLKSLLTSIENNLMLMDVVNVDFVPEGNSVQLTFYTYYLKE